jgi:serine/threonine protein kinase
MSVQSSSTAGSAVEEEDGTSSRELYFGHEFGRRYTGRAMDSLDRILPSDGDDGHCVFPIGFVVDHRYQIRSLIGRGTFCLVWIAFDHVMQENVAIKALKSSQNEMFEDESMINRHLTNHVTPDAKIVQFRRYFYHLDHACMVFELASHNVLTLLNYFDDPLVGIPRNLLKKVVRDTLEGLAFMHRNGVIHTDLKPENVLASRPLFPYGAFPGDEGAQVFDPVDDDPSTIAFKLSDIGNSCFVGFPSNSLIQTRQYRSPEVLLGLPYDTSADIWSLACMTFEFATGDHLFDPELDTDGEDDTSNCSDNKMLVDALHLAMFEQVIGPIPEDWARQGSEWTTLYRNGELLKRCEEELPPVFDQLVKHRIPEREATELADFLAPMLSIVPAQRPSAAEMLDSPWLRFIS